MSDEDKDNDDDKKHDYNTLLAPKEKTERPALYKVFLINDDFTPMEFVVLILQSLFNKSPEESAEITLTVHSKGVGVCGVFPYEIAETKAQQVMNLARKNQHPLQCRIEKE
ncbi:MAG: ATP-dependent Clp protease adapter ClpS [Alphaproteobacteria bacterium]|nr:ATP-dependent Clp protease adapter ClpS [Alphaproteobacteria bacterium]